MSKLNVLRVLGWLMVVALILLSLIKLPQAPVNIDGGDKLLHLGSYFFLSYWFYHVYDAHPWRVTAGFLLLGSILEWSQSLTTSRYVEWLDWLMNLSGVVLAWLVFVVIKFRLKPLQIDS